MMEYKGYTARVEFDDDAGVLFGEVLNLRDVVTFQGRTVDELRQAFRDSVDDYLAFCRSLGQPPDRPYSGRFVVRIDPDLHKAVATRAMLSRKSLNAWVQGVLESAVR